MTTEVATAASGGAIIEQVITKGDLSKLTPEERVRYYRDTCTSLGLNPLTRPLEYITLNGKLTLYARRDAADQLRKLNGISVEVVSRKIDDGILTVHVRAKDATGRTDEDFGCVNIANMKGEFLANATMKAVTKAKRRVTLSISGLGLLDETEVADIPAAQTLKPYGNGFRMAPNGGARSEPDTSSFESGQGGATPPPPTAETINADGEVIDAPDPRIAAFNRMQAEIGDMHARGDKDEALVTWWKANVGHIKALSEPHEAEIRAIFTSARKAAATPSPADNAGAGE